jgi:phage-related protein
MSEKDVPLEFVGSSRDDLSDFPLEAKKEIGLALRTAQNGQKADNAKPLKGLAEPVFFRLPRTSTATPIELLTPYSSKE